MSASKPHDSSEFESALHEAQHLPSQIQTLLRRVHDNDESLTERLYLRFQELGVFGAQALARALEVNTTVHALILNQTQFADAGAQALARALQINTTVHTLGLRNNQIADASAQAIARALETNTAVHALDLSANKIAVAGAQALARALETNTTLRTLWLGNNQIAVAGAQALARALETNTTVRTLNLSDNQIADAGAQALARALGTNTTLRTLDLRENQITVAGAQALALAVWRSRLQPGGLVYKYEGSNGNTWTTYLGLPDDTTLGKLLQEELPAQAAGPNNDQVLSYITALRPGLRTYHLKCLHIAHLFGFARDRPAVLDAYRRDVLLGLVEHKELPAAVLEMWQNGVEAELLSSRPLFSIDVCAIILQYLEIAAARITFNWSHQTSSSSSSI